MHGLLGWTIGMILASLIYFYILFSKIALANAANKPRIRRSTPVVPNMRPSRYLCENSIKNKLRIRSVVPETTNSLNILPTQLLPIRFFVLVVAVFSLFLVFAHIYDTIHRLWCGVSGLSTARPRLVSAWNVCTSFPSLN
jgi:hypothetical protein